MVLRLGDGEAWKLGGSADLRFGCLEPRRLGGLGGLKLLKLLSPLGWYLVLLGCSCGLLGATWEVLGAPWELLGVPGLEASEVLFTSGVVSGVLVVLLGCSCGLLGAPWEVLGAPCVIMTLQTTTTTPT